MSGFAVIPPDDQPSRPPAGTGPETTTKADPHVRRCDCHRCADARQSEALARGDLEAWADDHRMRVCPICGCKRCPKASDHDLACTGSMTLHISTAPVKRLAFEPLVAFAGEWDGNENWDKVCDFAETIPQIKEHLRTWGPQCGAPYRVYRGHLVLLILSLCR